MRKATQILNDLPISGRDNGIFNAADGDCVGLTNKVSWAKNKQWMELVAKGATPLFISAQPDAPEQSKKP